MIFRDPDGHDIVPLRDQMAMAALIGMLNSKALAHLRHEEQAVTAYRYADAMLAAREKET